MAITPPSIETVSPLTAERWLNENNTNRSLRPGVVEQYAADMRNGRWTQCAAPIAFYDDGDLADGQHRLYAIIESNTSQRFVILRGLARSDGLNIDTGLNRTVVDAARISGADQHVSNILIAVARAMATGQASTGRSSNAQKLAYLEGHRAACEWAVSHGPLGKNIRNSAMLGAIARAYTWETNTERLARFCKVVGDGFMDGDSETAAVAIRTYLLQHAGISTHSTNWSDTFLKIQNAIKYFMDGKRLTVIRGVKDEAYPLRKPRAVTRKKDKTAA